MATAPARQKALTVIVSGTHLQQVGFRAMIQKAAIVFNLAGTARNNLDGTVEVTLQGEEDRVDQTLAAICAGSKKSSRGNTLVEVPVEWDPELNTFTVFGWTSTSRNIANPYDLVFSLRAGAEQITHHEAKVVWNGIVESTLKGDDLAKFMKHLDDDD
jgi:acylphosphatase